MNNEYDERPSRPSTPRTDAAYAIACDKPETKIQLLRVHAEALEVESRAMSPELRKLMEDAKEHIEGLEYQIEEEWGRHTQLEEMIRDGKMSPIWKRITRALAEDEQNSGTAGPHIRP